MSEATGKILHQLECERDFQDRKWGEQNHHNDYWNGIIMEEVGEAAKVVIERGDIKELRAELMQVAAVAVCWIECLDRNTNAD